MMQGMFKANGGCGYVKKPDVLLSNGPGGETFDPSSKTLQIKTVLKVSSLSLILMCSFHPFLEAQDIIIAFLFLVK